MHFNKVTSVRDWRQNLGLEKYLGTVFVLSLVPAKAVELPWRTETMGVEPIKELICIIITGLSAVQTRRVWEIFITWTGSTGTLCWNRNWRVDCWLKQIFSLNIFQPQTDPLTKTDWLRFWLISNSIVWTSAKRRFSVCWLTNACTCVSSAKKMQKIILSLIFVSAREHQINPCGTGNRLWHRSQSLTLINRYTVQLCTSQTITRQSEQEWQEQRHLKNRTVSSFV